MRITKITSLVGIATFLMTASLSAATLERPYELVVVNGQQIPLLKGAPVNDLFVYRYESGNWQQIPFQIDETDGGNYFGAKNGILDDADEICFMASDMGDKMPGSWSWIDDDESRIYRRYQVRARDGVGAEAWVYIYRSSTLAQNFAPYMQYAPPAAGQANDFIVGYSYTFGHNGDAIPEHLSISPAVGGNNVDVLDRWKIRIGGQLPFIGSYEETEETGLSDPSLKVKNGPVRVIRQSTFDVYFQGLYAQDSSAFITEYRPYSAHIVTGDRQLFPQFGIQYLRQSTDYNAQMSGAAFYSTHNSESITVVDGTEDVIEEVVDINTVNWFMVTGANGTIATVFNLPDFGEAQELYYADDSVIDATDTGDQVSYGESGVQVSSSTVLMGTYGLEMNVYYLGPDRSAAFGDSLAQMFADPLAVSTSLQRYVVPVELAAFEAKAKRGDVELSWITATESNNYGFEIERRPAATPEWQCVAFVEGAGTRSAASTYHYRDRDLEPGSYAYRLRQIDSDGTTTLSEAIEVMILIPSQFVLEQNYPNPFNPATEIAFQISPQESGPVSLKVFNLMGQEIRTLLQTALQVGYHRVSWDGRDNYGRPVTSGTYIYVLEVGAEVAQKKMLKLE